jgi:AraC family transcriptional regulator of adaptative response / DNA-3-methyladenine glycosylase II
MDADDSYLAVRSRDGRFDGRFVTAVLTTKIYCRPSCPARTPLRRNVRFYAEPAAAEAAGFRACKRCRPQLAPDAPDVDVRGDLLGRALRLIADGVADTEGVAGVARRLAVSERHLHRVFVAELGVGPQAVARSRRLRLARALLETSDLPAGDVAFASGHASVRQFNDAVLAGTGATPTALRALAPGRREPGLALRLRWRPPYDAAAALRWVAAHAVPGVEEVTEDGYRRVVTGGTLQLSPRTDHWLLRLACDDPRATGRLARAARRMLDLDADPEAIAAVLGSDPALGPLVGRRPGLRCVGAFDGWEGLARTVVGQQVSVKGARTLCARLVLVAGTPLAVPVGTLTHAFPTAGQVAAADLAPVGLTGARTRTLQGLARAVADGSVVLDGSVPAADALRSLAAVWGVGPWTLSYAAMRVLRDPDAWPAGDLVLRRACAAHGLNPDTDSARWSPWRAYAATHLWEDTWF